MLKSITNAAGLIGTVIGILSIVALIDLSADVGWLPVVRKIIDFYQVQKLIILSPIVPWAEYLVNAIVGIFNVKIALLSHWSDIFVLMILYLGSRARSYWSPGSKLKATFRLLWGFGISLIVGVCAGLFPSTSVESNLAMVATVLAGLLLYDLIDAIWSATFHREENLSWADDSIRYLKYSMPTMILGLFFLIIFWIFYPDPMPETVINPGVLMFLVFTFILAFYWLFRGLQSSLNNPNKLGTGLQSFIRSSNTKIAFLMLASLCGAAMFVAFGAGHS